MAEINISSDSIRLGYYDGSQWWDWEDSIRIASSHCRYIRFTIPSGITISNYNKLIISIYDTSSTYGNGVYYTINYALHTNSVNLNNCIDITTGSMDTLLYYNTIIYDCLSENTIEIDLQYIYNKTGTKLQAGKQYYLLLNGNLTTGTDYTTVERTNVSISLSSVDHYIYYNANGGTGAPSTGIVSGLTTSYTISGTKPTHSNTSSSSNFTIKGNANGGNSDIILTATKNTNVSYTFLGWSTNSSATSATYSASQTISISGSITLYAIWGQSESYTYSNNTISALGNNAVRDSKNIVYNITLDPNDGPADITTLASNSVINYTLAGWGASPYSTELLSGDTAFTSDISVYAIWNENLIADPIELPSLDNNNIAKTFIVTLDPNKGTVSTTSLTATKNSNYVFLGWGESKDASAYVDKMYTPNNNITLYAIWEITIIEQNPVTLPTPTRSGRNFLGWSVNQFSTVYLDTTYMPEESLTIYANWSGIIYNIPYIYHNGEWRKGTIDIT